MGGAGRGDGRLQVHVATGTRLLLAGGGPAAGWAPLHNHALTALHIHTPSLSVKFAPDKAKSSIFNKHMIEILNVLPQ